MADLSLKRASADIAMALKTAAPFLTGNQYLPMEDANFEATGGGPAEGGASKARIPYATAAITTTVRYASSDTIAAFCRWHLLLGFSHIFMFFEDPQEAFHFKQYCRKKLTPETQLAEEGKPFSYVGRKSVFAHGSSSASTCVVVVKVDGNVVWRNPVNHCHRHCGGRAC